MAKRTEIGIALFGVLIVAGIVAGIALPRDGGRTEELREVRQALDEAEAQLDVLDTELTKARDELAAAEASVDEAEAALAEAPAPPAPIYREVGAWSHNGFHVEVNSIEYWGTTLNSLESRLEIEAEGDYGLLDPVPTLAIVCFADGTRSIEIDDIPLEPLWSEERDRYEYEIAYQGGLYRILATLRQERECQSEAFR